MVSSIDHIRNILSDNRPEDALTEMQGWMAPGDKALMKALVSMKRKQGSRSLGGELGKLLDQIERESPKLTSFLGHYHAANKAFEEKQWGQARFHLEEAIELHQSEYLALKPDLVAKLERLGHQEKMEELIRQANAHFSDGNWKEALVLFKKARSHYFPGSEWSMDNFEGVITLCKNGLSYENHVSTATSFQQQGKWSEAITEFRKARQFYHPDCKPDLTVLEEEIRWSEQQATMDTREVVLDRPMIVMLRRYLLPVLFTLTIGALAWLFLKYPEWTAGEDVISSVDLNEAVSAVNEQSDSPEESTSSDEAFFSTESESGAPQSENSPVASFFEEETPLTREASEALPIPPVPQSNLTGSFEAGKEVEIQLSNYDPSFQYQIDFGDGTVAAGAEELSHIYEEPGTYQIVLKASNALGGGNAVSRTVEIKEAIEEPSNIEVTPIPIPVATPEPTVQQTNDSAIELPVNRPVAPRDFADVMPQFPGGNSALRAYLDSETRYPEQARENELEGKVYIQFVVGTDGSLSDIKLARGIGFGCDDEALRLVRSMPRWVPGSHQGTTQPVRYTLPITFVLK